MSELSDYQVRASPGRGSRTQGSWAETQQGSWGCFTAGMLWIYTNNF